MACQTRKCVEIQDRQTLMQDFNATDDPSLLGRRLDELFENVVAQFPDNTALIHDKHAVTYGELNASANQFARCLGQRDLEAGDVVGLALSRSVNLIVSLLAVIKLGASYVPIDPMFPANRIDQMVEDAGLKCILLGEDSPVDNFLRWKSLCLNVDGARAGTTVTDSTNLQIRIDPEDVAYIIYTSGSTGRPKGVEISHGAAANFLSSLCRYDPGCSENDRLLAITTISFDMSALEIFLPLLSGSTMVIANRTAVKDPRELITLMEDHQITILQATPATWTMLLESGWKDTPRLSKIICGGEPLSRQLADQLLARADSVWNVYGPSETTYGSVGRVDHGEIVVGKPVANGRIYVLDESLSSMPIGSEGEVFIGGGSVSNGYRNKPELTQSRFLENPFHGGRFFRTGDVGKFIGPGQLKIVGRKDGLVKLHGNRIDVGEIEAVLTDHANVSKAVVLSRDDRLVAYCVLSMPLHGAQLADLLRPWVCERLPSYMLPTFFVSIEAFPLSPNEKIDLKALPDPIETIRCQNTAQPSSILEQQILAIWKECLGHDRIGLEDNFFNIGGDSVRVIRMQASLEKHLCRRIPTPKLFEYYTIKSLAAYLSGSTSLTNNQDINERLHAPAGRNEDIAIISMTCRLPGNIETPEDFWQLLEDGGGAIIDVPHDRWDASKLFNSDPDGEGTSYSCRGGFLASVFSYDTSLIGISPREAQAMDPLHYLMLELGWEGFERAGFTKAQLSGSSTGVFIGVSDNAATNGAPADLKGHSITGSASATISGRLSYMFGLQGPSMTIDTACSSSLVATHLACSALRQGECNMALAGSGSLLLTPGIHVEMSKLRALSADGRCRSFSEDTDGTGFSEGAVAIVLKRLSDAERDGDNIQAILRGSAVMHGGSSPGLTVPSGPGQVNLIRTALARATLEPRDIDYVEAHGTATKLGDPIEATALAEVFGNDRPSSNHPLRIGSSKSNLGHTQAAAGLVGLVKVVLSLQKNALPQTIHVSKPTRAVDWKATNMELALTKKSWPFDEKRPRRAGVSAFGLGGTNAHVIVEEYVTRNFEGLDENTPVPLLATHLFILSGTTDSAIRAQANKLHCHMRSDIGKNDCLADIAYSLATTRNTFNQRIAMTSRTKEQMMEKLHSITSGSGTILNANDEVDPVLLFTGQGSQYLGMGKQLYTLYPAFREAFDQASANFTDLQSSLRDILWADPKSANAALIHRTDIAQPALFTLEVALWSLWKSWGVTPAFLLGHSLGELVVAHVAGVLSLSDACRLVMMRGRLMQALPSGRGKMVALEASSIRVESCITDLKLGGRVDIAGYNTPTQVVTSGDADAVLAVAAEMARKGHKTKILDTGHAYHSFHMDAMLDDFRAVLLRVEFNQPVIPIVSSMTGRMITKDDFIQPEYWVRQVRQAVRFDEAIRQLSDLGAKVFVEIGPEPILCGLGASCVTTANCWLPSLRSDTEDTSVIRNSIGELHMRGVAIDWEAYYKPFQCRRIKHLPTYAFQRDFHHPARTWTPKITPDRNIDEMMFEVNWREISVGDVRSGGSWGFICSHEETPWCRDVQKALSSAGLRLVVVQEPQDAENFDGLISLWESSSDDVVEVAHTLTAKALTQLQEIIRRAYTKPVVWVTHHSISTGSCDEPISIGASPLYGLMRTARSENPDLALHLIDVDEESIGAALMLSEYPEVALREGKAFVPHLEQSVSQTARKPLLVRSDGAVLVTGGLGDLGRRATQRLAISYSITDLIILSRRGMESPGADTLIAELKELGAKCIIIACDIADVASLQSAIEEITTERPLRGVIHAAGVVDSGVLSSLTQQKCIKVLAPKLGLWNLHRLTSSMDLDIFMMFSSISGVMGLPGLGNYAAANCFLDELAHLRHAQGLPATSIAYGPWAGDGMGTSLVSTTRTHLSQLGLGFIEPDDGLKLLDKAISRGRALTVAAHLDLPKLKAYFEEQQNAGVPRLLRSMLPKIEAEKPVERFDSLRHQLAEATPEQSGEIVLHAVQATIAKALGYDRVSDVDTSRPLQELGIDSLTAVLMRNHLSTLTGLALPPNTALLHPNIRSLSSFLLSQLLEDIASGSSGTSEPGIIMPSSTASSGVLVNMSGIQTGVLDPELHFDNVSSKLSSGTVESVLVTGATGFVGAFMVSILLKRGITTYCLVRASSFNEAQERIEHTLKQYQLWHPDHEQFLKPVVGNLTLPLLGLTKELFDDLANRLDSILHAGALVDWMRPLSDYILPNILSTHEILRLASHGRPKAIHFISTISTLLIHAGYSLDETKDSEYGYGTSKYLAERLIVAARFRGARAFTYRLPLISASTATGQFRRDRGDFLHNLISGSLEIGTFPSLDADLSSVLPVDYLCDTIAAVMLNQLANTQQRWEPEDYDYVHLRAPRVDQFFENLALAGGLEEKEPVPFGAWHSRAVEYAAAHPKSALARISTILDGHDDETAGALFKGCCAVGRHVFGGEVYPAPVLGEEYVRKYVECIRAQTTGEHQT